jgi:hypothetical protein
MEKDNGISSKNSNQTVLLVKKLEAQLVPGIHRCQSSHGQLAKKKQNNHSQSCQIARQPTENSKGLENACPSGNVCLNHAIENSKILGVGRTPSQKHCSGPVAYR